jgi:hypothetical protein
MNERPVSEHRVQRPSWRCVVDGTAWPCEPARRQLTEAYGDRSALAALLATLMARAADDLGVADPTDLYGRFLAWTTNADEACRACGRIRHAAVAGLPPRLIPCDKLREINRPPQAGHG